MNDFSNFPVFANLQNLNLRENVTSKANNFFNKNPENPLLEVNSMENEKQQELEEIKEEVKENFYEKADILKEEIKSGPLFNVEYFKPHIFLIAFAVLWGLILSYFIRRNYDGPLEISNYTPAHDITDIFNSLIKNNTPGFYDTVFFITGAFISQYFLIAHLKPWFGTIFLYIYWLAKDFYIMILLVIEFSKNLKFEMNFGQLSIYLIGRLLNPVLILSFYRIAISRQKLNWMKECITITSNVKKAFIIVLTCLLSFINLAFGYFFAIFVTAFLLFLPIALVGFFSFCYILIPLFITIFTISELIRRVFTFIVRKFLLEYLFDLLDTKEIEKKNIENYCIFLEKTHELGKYYIILVIFSLIFNISVSYCILLLKGCNYADILSLYFTFPMIGGRLTEKYIEFVYLVI